MSDTEPSKDAEQLLAEEFSQKGESPVDVFLQLYEELRRVAHALMQGENPDHTLQTTVLVNEAFLRLFKTKQFRYEDRQHLFRIVARCMRHILVDHARSRRSKEHGGEYRKVPLEKINLENQGPFICRDLPQLLALDQALNHLAELSPRQVKIVELHFFAGLTEEEITKVLNISLGTVKRDWRLAKAWLRTKMME